MENRGCGPSPGSVLAGVTGMKILHILATPRAEGTPNLVLDWLMTGLHEQEVFALESKPNDLTSALSNAARWYGEADEGLLSGWRQFPRITGRIRQVCMERKPDLIICWVLGLAGWICLGARMAGVKTLLVHAGNPPNRGFKNDWLTRYVNWPLWALGAKVVCCSRYVHDELKSVSMIPKDLFHAVHNCSRTEAVKHRAAKVRQQRVATGVNAIMVATLERHKDHETLFRAMVEVLRIAPEFHLNLAGDGSLRALLQDRVQELRLAHAVTFLGSRRDVPELLGQSDLFIFSTTSQEGLGSVLLEAMAAGLPIVATDVPACRELLEDGRWGILVPAANSEALASGILQLVKNLNSEDSVEKGSLEAYLKEFAPQVMIERYLALAAADGSARGSGCFQL